jgi:hypothetical protein
MKNKENIIKWWNNKNREYKQYLTDCYFDGRKEHSLTPKEIGKIYNYEQLASL